LAASAARGPLSSRTAPTKRSPPAGDGADQPLFLATVSDRVAHRRNPAADRGFRNNATVPDRANQFIPANNPFAMADEMEQKIEDLRLDRDEIHSAPQFSAIVIEREILEKVDD
jgi:hypothetical protein